MRDFLNYFSQVEKNLVAVRESAPSGFQKREKGGSVPPFCFRLCELQRQGRAEMFAFVTLSFTAITVGAGKV